MRTRKTTVVDALGREREADMAVCDCGRLDFLVLQISGQRHVHYQCVRCSTSYCPGGECEKERSQS